MIALSWLFLLAAVVTLLVGVFTDLVWVYVSIGASVLAMILLLVGIVRRKPVQPATAGAPYGPTVEQAATRERQTAAAATATTAPATSTPPAQRRPTTPAPATAPASAPPARKPAAKKTTAKKTTAKSTAKATSSTSTGGAKKTAAKKTTAAAPSGRAMVVTIPERGTYHTATCRYVQDRTDTERLQKKTAQSRGFKACGVCKP